MTEVKRRKRRSKRTIAREKAAKEARRQERLARAAEKRVALEAEESARRQQAYDAQTAYIEERARQRRIQEQGVEWLMGYDTPAARKIEEFYQRNRAAVQHTEMKARRAGDPLNITGHTPPPSKKQQKRQAEAERLARGEFKEIIPDLDNPRQNVLVTALPHSFRRMKRKLETHQQPAAERFLADWEAASYTGLSSMPFDPRVDSSPKIESGHLRATEAQHRLKMAKAHIGERNYDICVGVLILNRSAGDIHSLGGRDHRSVSSDIDVALNALTGFYDPVRLSRDPTWRAFQKAIEIGLGVIRQGEEEVR
jgi:hypothetical protein